MDNGSASALGAFRAGFTIYQSSQMTDAPKEIFQQALRDARKYLETANSQLPHVDRPEVEDKLVLDNIERLTSHLREWAKQKGD